MKVLIAYYSRTGITERIANMIKEELNADIERIDDGDKFKGPIGYLKGGFNAVGGRLCEIKPPKKDPSNYDLTIIATPVWGSHPTPGVLTYIVQNKDKFNDVAGFATCNGSGGEKTLSQISNACGKKLKATMSLTAADIDENLNKEINTFINKL